MSDMKIDIPDITVVIVPGHEYTTAVTPSEVYQVDVNVGDIYSVNLQQPDIIVTDGTSSVYEMAQLAGYAFYAGTSSLALNAITASYAINPQLPVGSVSSSYQIALNEISGSIFSANNFTFPQDLTVGGTLFADKIFISSSVIYESGSTKFGDSLDDTHEFTGSLLVNRQIIAPSITGSFKGDGSQLTGLVTDLRISGSSGSDTVSLLTDTLSVLGNRGITTTVTNNQITIAIPEGSVSSSQQILDYDLFATTGSNIFVGDQTITGSIDVTGDIWVTPGVVNQLTSSYAIKAENIGIINAGTYEAGNDAAITPLLGITRVTSASYATTASYVLNVSPSPSASYALTASYALNAGAETASYALAALTASYAMNAAASGLTSSLLSIDTYYFVGDGLTTNYSLSKIYADYSLIVSVGGVTYMSPNDYTISGNTLSFIEPPYSSSNILVRGFVNVTNNVTGSFSGSFVGIATTASYAITASYALSATAVSPPGTVSSSAQITAFGFISQSVNTGSFATTGSNTFVGNQIVSGNIHFEEGKGIVGYNGGNSSSLFWDGTNLFKSQSGQGLQIKNTAGYTQIGTVIYGMPSTSDVWAATIDFNEGSNTNSGIQMIVETGDNQYQWLLTRSGSLMFPDNTHQTTAYTGMILPTSSLGSPQTGSMYFSGSYIYVYDGTQYRSASLN